MRKNLFHPLQNANIRENKTKHNQIENTTTFIPLNCVSLLLLWLCFVVATIDCRRHHRYKTRCHMHTGGIVKIRMHDIKKQENATTNNAPSIMHVIS